MSYIYKIINKINNKIYVGYTSRSVERRFYEHCWAAENTNCSSILHLAINKYGKNSFQIEVIKKFDEKEEDWIELEKYYIKYFNSLSPNGYNVLEGGDKPPTHFGEDNIMAKIPERELDKIIDLLKNTYIPIVDIAKKFNVSKSQISRINQGKSRKRENINYPIRKYKTEYEERAVKIIELLTKGVDNQTIAKKYDMDPRDIASINNGKKYNHLYNGSYPIRKQRFPQTKKHKKQAFLVANFIKENPNTTKINIQRKLNIGRFTVDKIICGQHPYNLKGVNYPLL